LWVSTLSKSDNKIPVEFSTVYIALVAHTCSAKEVRVYKAWEVMETTNIKWRSNSTGSTLSKKSLRERIFKRPCDHYERERERWLGKE